MIYALFCLCVRLYTSVLVQVIAVEVRSGSRAGSSGKDRRAYHSVRYETEDPLKPLNTVPGKQIFHQKGQLMRRHSDITMSTPDYAV